jgi:FHA domain
MSEEMPPPPAPAWAKPIVNREPIIAPPSTRPKVPYEPPQWAQAGSGLFCFEVLRGGLHIETVRMRSEDPSAMFVSVGRADCDIVCAHASLSRYHAVLQFGSPQNDPNLILAAKPTGEPVVMYIFDLGSTHGTRINKRVIPVKKFVATYEGDHVAFGESSRIYVVSCHGANPPVRSVANGAAGVTPFSSTPGKPPKEESKKAAESRKKQESLMAELDNKAAKREGFISEIEFIEAKANTQELTAGQLRQIQALSLKVEKLEDDIKTQSETLRNEEEALLDGDDGGATTSRHVPEAMTGTDDVDDQTDLAETLNQFVPASLVSDHRTAETAESLIEKLDGLGQIVEMRSRELVKFAHLRGANKQSTTRVDCNEDSLDAFMAQNEDAIIDDQRAKALRAYLAASDEYNRVKQMTTLATRGSDLLERVPTGPAASKLVISERAGEPKFCTKDDGRPEHSARGTLAPKVGTEALTSNDIAVASRPGKRQRISSENDLPVSSGGNSSTMTRQISIDADGGEYNWVPPAGQRGDGKSELNAKYGY